MTTRPLPTLTLSVRAARAIHLAAQGLLTAWPRRARKVDVLAAIERMQLLQIDTIHVVARSPYLVLYSRLGHYPSDWLDELLADGAVFETWAHEACFAPMANWPWLHQHSLAKDHHWAIRSAKRTHAGNAPGMVEVLEKIRAQGAMRSSDFSDGDRPRGGWWGWKDEKRWLEAWFALGELMVARRDNFQRVYDLSDRVLASAGIDRSAHVPIPVDTLRRQVIERSVRALGIARPEWVADYYRLGGRVDRAELDELVAMGRLFRAEVRGWSGDVYIPAELRPLAERAAMGRLRPTLCTVLSPFDPVVWDRRRALELFDFDYRLECYVPQPKREFGYFVLPLLHRGRLIGRVDAKAHRDQRVFEVRRFALEADQTLDAALAATLAEMFRRLAAWHGCDAVSFAPSSAGRGVLKALGAALAAIMSGNVS